MLIESRAHRAVSLLRTIPQLGPIRAAFIVATVDTPHRFRTKRQFWSYIGLAVVTHMSSEYEMKAGRVVRCRKPISTRGLNQSKKAILQVAFISSCANTPERIRTSGLWFRRPSNVVVILFIPH
jgi:transposase